MLSWWIAVPWPCAKLNSPSVRSFTCLLGWLSQWAMWKRDGRWARWCTVWRQMLLLHGSTQLAQTSMVLSVIDWAPVTTSGNAKHVGEAFQHWIVLMLSMFFISTFRRIFQHPSCQWDSNFTSGFYGHIWYILCLYTSDSRIYVACDVWEVWCEWCNIMPGSFHFQKPLGTHWYKIEHMVGW